MAHCDVLVLDDEVLIAMDVEQTLTDVGYREIAVCHTADDALAQISKSCPNIALLDFDLGNGETCIRVAEQLSDCGVPFILMTGDVDATGNLPDGINAADSLDKPFPSTALLDCVQNVLRGSLRPS